MRVAYQGEPGAYSEAATIRFFGAGVEPVPCASFDEVFRQVQAGECDRGTVPIENSLAGSIHRNYDLLLRHNLSIVGELILRVSHNLIANQGVALCDLERVYSHPQALDQCEQTLNALLPHVQRIPTYDTAGSVKLLRESDDRHAAAVASRRAAEIYGMSILQENLEDRPSELHTLPHPQPRIHCPQRTRQDLRGLRRQKRAWGLVQEPQRLRPARH